MPASRPPRARRDELILDALERLLTKSPMSALDVEQIAAESGITRTRFYAYYTSKNDALAALLRRILAIRNAAYEHPDSWFTGRLPHVRPRDAVRTTIAMIADRAWAYRHVLREACDLWTAVPEIRDTWLDVIGIATAKHEEAILRERSTGSAPPGHNARRVAEAITWQAERLYFLSWAELPGTMTKDELTETCLETYMRLIFLSDDPDPQPPALRQPADDTDE